MDPDMTGKVALVTGASRGIGAAVARAFGTAGARVALVADADALDRLARELVGDDHALASTRSRPARSTPTTSSARARTAGGRPPAMPMKRIGRPEEVADAVVWLCSEQAGFITATTLFIDGGKLAGTPPFRVTLTPR